MRDELLQALTELRLDGQALEQEVGSDGSYVSSSIALVDEDGTIDTVFEVLFREMFSPSDTGATYLVITWVMFPPDEVLISSARRPELLALVNTLNAEPGVKVRVEVDGDAEAVLCETDLLMEDTNARTVEAALARTRDAVALYFDSLEPLVRG